MRGDSESEHDDEDVFDFEDMIEQSGDVESYGGALPYGKMTFEGVLGLLAAFFIGLPAPFLAGIAVGQLLPGPARWLGIAAFVVTGYLSLLVVRLAARATEGDGGAGRMSGRMINIRSLHQRAATTAKDASRSVVVPLAIAMAMRLPNWPALCRPFIGVWWLSHFAAAAFIGHAVAALAARGLNNAGGVLSVPLTLMATFAFVFAGNLYLMLAVAACVRRPGVWLIVWRHRFFVDLILAAFLLFAGP